MPTSGPQATLSPHQRPGPSPSTTSRHGPRRHTTITKPFGAFRLGAEQVDLAGAGLYQMMAVSLIDAATGAVVAEHAGASVLVTPDPPPECLLPFDDVSETSVHGEYICRLVQAEITIGTSPTIYNPSGDVTRAQMATSLVRALGLDPIADAGDDAFPDVDPGNVHTPNIYAVRDAGIMTGATATNFDPSRDVRRDQMASFLIRLLDYLDEQA